MGIIDQRHKSKTMEVMMLKKVMPVTWLYDRRLFDWPNCESANVVKCMVDIESLSLSSNRTWRHTEKAIKVLTKMA
jgi:hypothetical protein